MRFDGVDAYGELQGRHYDYPDGYSYPADETPTRADLRRSMIPDLAERLRRRHDLDQLDDVEGGATVVELRPGSATG